MLKKWCVLVLVVSVVVRLVGMVIFCGVVSSASFMLIFWLLVMLVVARCLVLSGIMNSLFIEFRVLWYV